MVILKALIICWTNLKSEKEVKIKEDLREVSRLFVKVVENDDEDGINSQIEILVEADSRLKELFSS